MRAKILKLGILGLAAASLVESRATAQCRWNGGGALPMTAPCNVGVGSDATPQGTLHVTSATQGVELIETQSGGANPPVLQLRDSRTAGRSWNLYSGNAGAGTFSLFDTNAGATRLLVDTSGKVGVGTTTPGSSGGNYGQLLEVSGVSGISALILTGNKGGADGYVADVAFTNSAMGTSDNRMGVVRYSRSGADNSGQFSVWTRNAGAWVTAIQVAPNGDATFVGKVTGANIQAQYQDLAEWVPASQNVGAGMVVVLDPAKSNHVVASKVAYDPKVAGVVSPRPGVTLGEAGEGKVLVATTGRVKVRADAAKSPIRVGDLLVTSDREGYAMKSEPIEISGRQFHQPGTLIGKALEPLESGTDEILVLLSLQ